MNFRHTKFLWMAPKMKILRFNCRGCWLTMQNQNTIMPFSQMLRHPQNPRKFCPTKISCYMVFNFRMFTFMYTLVSDSVKYIHVCQHVYRNLQSCVFVDVTFSVHLCTPMYAYIHVSTCMQYVVCNVYVHCIYNVISSF